MSDIIMCKGNNCPLIKNCYRYLAKKGIRQSYFVNIPYDKELKLCKYFWKIKNNEYGNKKY